jgi:hypothetical protein
VLGLGAFGVANAFSANIYMYIVLRFLTAVSNQGTFMLAFVLGE